jgi:predicted SAM-dependent methyltransferase
MPLPHSTVSPERQLQADMPARATPLIPPASPFGKFAFYRRRYGAASTLARLLGRKFPGLWRLIGPASTRGYLSRWLARPGRHILNLGGGSNCMAECLTVDVDARADAYVDVTRPLPFPDECFDAVFCEEVIEHIDRAAGRRLLAECARVLRPGGILRVTTPDLAYFAHRVLAAPDDPAEINGIFYDHGHLHIYTPESLARACQEAGFESPQRSGYRDPESRLGWLDSHADRFGRSPEISQYTEALRSALPGKTADTTIGSMRQL